MIGAQADAVDLALPVRVGGAEQEGFLGIGGVDVVGEFLAVHHLQGAVVLLRGEAAVVADADAVTLGTLLGRDDDDAVGSAGTVDGGRGGVLQDGEGLDVVGVDRGEGVAHEGAAFLGDRDTVDDDERVVARGQRGAAADTEGRLGSGFAGGGNDVQTRHLADEGLGGTGDRTAVDIVGLDGDDGSRHILFLDGAVADDHDIIQIFGIRQEMEGRRDLGGRECLGGVADAADHHRRVRTGHGQFVFAVETRGGARRGALFHHSGPDDGSHLVDDDSLDLVAVLGGQTCAEECEEHDRHSSSNPVHRECCLC